MANGTIKRPVPIEKVVVNGTTSSLGNLNTGINGSKIVIAAYISTKPDSEDGSFCNPFWNITEQCWYVNVRKLWDNSTKNNTAITLNCIVIPAI